MKSKRINETQRINHVVVLSYTLITIILLIAYILELVKGNRTLQYTMIFAIMNVSPYLVCLVTYLKNRESTQIKYTFSIGFSILYVFVLLTAAVPTTFVYMFLIFFLLIPYGDLKLCYITGGTATVANLVSIGIGFSNGSLTMADLAMVEIQLLSIAFATFFTALSTSVIGKANAQKIDELNEEKEKIDNLLSHTLMLSQQISNDIDAVSLQMKHIEQSAVATKDSMQDVTLGANEMAESMQSQLLQTREIVELAEKAQDVSDSIVEAMDQTEAAIILGKDGIDLLLTCVNHSESAGLTVSSRMQELMESTEKMNSIVELINSVTKKTNLLSLNASIEAARAGEAGKGFAVVAQEISLLAHQTSEATIDITGLIENISLSINEVFKAANQLMESNKEQNQSAESMALNFEQIERCTHSINEAGSKLKEVIQNLAQSNESIVRSINTVSAVTQEVSARANETLSVSESNATVVKKITNVIEELNDKAKQLNE